MSDRYERVQRGATRLGSVDAEAGEFSAILATSGEASDGHILNVRGIETPDGLPMQIDHSMSALGTLGSLRGFEIASQRGQPDELRTRGKIRLTGDGAQLALRRDVLDAIDAGDINAMSLRWEGVEVSDRTALPKDHPAHVPRNDPDPRKRYGLYFEQSRALEGSLVAIPADRGALIQRSEDREDSILRDFWRTLAEGAHEPASRWPEIVAALEERVASLQRELASHATLKGHGADDPEETPEATIEPATAERMVCMVEQLVGDFERRQERRIAEVIRSLTHGTPRRAA